MYSTYTILDLETIADDAMLPLLDPPEPAKNLKDPAKIEANVAERAQAQRDRMSLDPFCGRIVCIGMQTPGAGPQISICLSDEDERVALRCVADTIRHEPSGPVIGFDVSFDLCWCMTRARLLGVDFPQIDLRPYNTHAYVDLANLLDCNGQMPAGAMKRSLQNYARRFGIPVTDHSTGADIAGFYAAGDWDRIMAHCRSDVELTAALARRLEVIA